MSKIGFQRNVYKLNFKLKINFIYKTYQVYSITQKQYDKLYLRQDEIDIPKDRVLFGVYIPEHKEYESEFGYLVIDSTFNLNSYDSLNSGSANIRPDIFIVLGILSFITNEAFIPANSFRQSAYNVPYHIARTNEKIIAKVDKQDLSVDLRKILSVIENSEKEKQILYFTILERWRKAMFLESESEEGIFNDEAVLAYMHILEILSDEFKVELKKENNVTKSKLSEEIIKYAQDINCSSGKLKKLLNSFSETKVGFKEKVFHLLDSFSLSCPKSKAIVERFIEHRNAIAHGRKNLYQERLVFPLPQFFSFIKDIDEDIELIKVLSARCISILFNLDLWKSEWEYILLTEVPVLNTVKDFLKNKAYESLDLLKENNDGIYPPCLAYYYKKGKLEIKDLEEALMKTILLANENKQDYQLLYDAAIILSDTNNNDLITKCKMIVSSVYKNNWYYHSNIRDVIKDYEYCNRKLIWFSEWLSSDRK